MLNKKKPSGINYLILQIHSSRASEDGCSHFRVPGPRRIISVIPGTVVKSQLTDTRLHPPLLYFLRNHLKIPPAADERSGRGRPRTAERAALLRGCTPPDHPDRAGDPAVLLRDSRPVPAARATLHPTRSLKPPLESSGLLRVRIIILVDLYFALI